MSRDAALVGVDAVVACRPTQLNRKEWHMTQTINPKEKSQPDKFKEAAREHGCDEDEKAFDEKLRRLAKQQPKKEKPAD